MDEHGSKRKVLRGENPELDAIMDELAKETGDPLFWDVHRVARSKEAELVLGGMTGEGAGGHVEVITPAPAAMRARALGSQGMASPGSSSTMPAAVAPAKARRRGKRRDVLGLLGWVLTAIVLGVSIAVGIWAMVRGSLGEEAADEAGKVSAGAGVGPSVSAGAAEPAASMTSEERPGPVVGAGEGAGAAEVKSPEVKSPEVKSGDVPSSSPAKGSRVGGGGGEAKGSGASGAAKMPAAPMKEKPAVKAPPKSDSPNVDESEEF
jgi:hypothetical protein